MKEIFEKIKFIEKLHAAGLLSNEQGTELLNIATKNTVDKFSQKSGSFQNSVNAIKSGFFNQKSRKDLKDFFENNFKLNENFDEKTFVKLLENLENDVIANYQKEKDFESGLSTNNAAAKGKLTSQAQGTTHLNPDTEKIYTRKEIDEMSLEDYQAHEKEIMSQVEKGLIA